MSYDANKPANDGFIAEAPQELRTNFEGLKKDQIVDAGTLKGLNPGNANGNIPIANGNVNINLNAEKLQGKTPADFAPAGWVAPAATGSSNGAMSNVDKTKLDGIQNGAEVNQNAFSSVLVGSTTIQADSKTDILELAAGANISLTPDAVNDRVTVAVTGKVPSASSADSAVNADTVDGKHASDFAPAGYGLGTVAADISGKDLNLDQPTGFYRGANLSNAPNKGWFYIINITNDVLWSYQEAISFGSANEPNIRYCRVKVNNVWGDWRELSYITQKPFIIAATAPSDTSKIWIDNNAVAYIHNGSAWVALRGVYLD